MLTLILAITETNPEESRTSNPNREMSLLERVRVSQQNAQVQKRQWTV